MRVVEGRSGSRLRLWIGVLVTVLMVAAFTPAVLNGSTMSAKSQTIPAGVSSKAVVLAGAGHFAPPHSDSGYDANGNGLFDFLLVNASVQITAPGNFTVSGTLHKANSTLQIHNLTSAGLPVGPANLTIWFDGRPINQSGIDGPYTVDLILVNETSSLLDIGKHTTQPYSHLDFDPMPAFMTPPHPDSGQDTNGNGLFDLLNVDVQVQVNVPANYSVSAFLHTANSTLALFAFASVFLPIGPGSIRVSFPGWPINQSGVDGPYTVELQLYESSTGFPLGSNTTTTQGYSHLDFDPIPAFMTPPHPDSGEDTNGNGLFDFLNVDVQVHANLPDNYTVNGFLHTANFTLAEFASGSAFLPIGPGSIRVPFAGGPINQSGIDGPYTVELQLSEAGSSVLLGMNTTTTQAYSHLAFDGPTPVPPIQSSSAVTTPTIDGVITSGEWNDSTLVNLTAISGNTLPAYLLVKNSPTMLYMAYDAVGDTSLSSADAAALAFDTGNDAVASNGHEDQFVQGGFGGNPSNQSHWVYNSSLGYWSVEDAPYNPGLPNHAGLASAWGFGPSPALGANHRMYEFAIPLALLGSGPNQTLGFFGGSQQSPGVADFPPFRYSLWPVFSLGPIPLASYGDLILAGGGGDTTPPSIAIDSPAPGAIIPVNSITVNWSASDVGVGLDHFDLSLDGGAPVTLDANVTSYTVSGLSDGNHTVQVTAVDGAGNAASTSVSVIVDTTPPVLSITYPTAGTVFGSTTVAVAWSASDAASGLDHFELSVDGGPVTVLGPSEVNYTFTSLSQGSHVATVVAFDLAGHSTAATRSFTVDTAAPTIVLSAPAAGYVSTRNVLVTWTASDNVGLDHIEVSLDGGAPVTLAASATSYTLTGVPDGPHTISVLAVDLAGSSTSDSVDVTVDATLPIASITTPISGQILGTNSVMLTWTASDATSGIDHLEVSVDGGVATSLAAGTTSYPFSGLSDGSHTFRLRAVDRAGNSATTDVTVMVDVTKPTASITSPAASAYLASHSVVVRWTAADPTSGIDHYSVAIDGGAALTVDATATSYTFSGVADGPHTIRLTAVDRAGNTVLASVSVTVDTVDPTISIVGPASGAVLSSSAPTVTWTADDATSGIDHIEVRVDGGSAQTLSSGATSDALSGLSDGTHTVNVTVLDKAGHSSSKSVSFRVDTSFVSPSGPYGIAGLTSIMLLIVVVLVAALLIVRRRRRPRAPT